MLFIIRLLISHIYLFCLCFVMVFPLSQMRADCCDDFVVMMKNFWENTAGAVKPIFRIFLLVSLMWCVMTIPTVAIQSSKLNTRQQSKKGKLNISKLPLVNSLQMNLFQRMKTAVLYLFSCAYTFWIYCWTWYLSYGYGL